MKKKRTVRKHLASQSLVKKTREWLVVRAVADLAFLPDRGRGEVEGGLGFYFVVVTARTFHGAIARAAKGLRTQHEAEEGILWSTFAFEFLPGTDFTRLLEDA